MTITAEGERGMRDKLAEAAARELDREVMNGVELTHYDRLNSAVRAVLLALREPTPQMIAAAWELIDEEKKRVGIFRLGPGVGASDIFTAMVDAALAEPILSERTEGEGHE